MSDQTIRRFSAVVDAARRSSGFITTEEMSRLGIPQSTVTRWSDMGLLIRMQRGVFRTQRGGFGFNEGLDLAMKIASAQQVIGARSALEVWELPGGLRTKVHLIGPRGARSRSSYVVVSESRDLKPIDITGRGRLRVTTPLRSIIDAAPQCSSEVIGEQLTAGVARKLFTYRDAQIRIAELSKRGRRGPAQVRKVLRSRHALDKRLSNPYEKLALGVITAARFPPPVAQYRIDVGGRTYYVDFAWPRFGVIVECDSMLAHSTPEQLAADLARQNDLVAAGWTPVRFTYWDVSERPEAVIAQLSRHLPRAVAA